jgi:hypothetical protein
MTVASRRPCVAPLLGSMAVLLAATHATPASAADDDPLMQCIAASNKGLDLRKQGKLIEARRELAACAAPSCSAEISGVCQKRIAEINAALPSMIFLPRDGAGKDMLGVRMTIDGQGPPVVLDGRPVVVDPGPHTFKLEVDGVEPVTRSLIVAEGAKDRQERVDMGPAPAATAPGAATETGAAAPAGHGSPQKAIGLWVGGAGVVGVAAGTVFGLLAMSQWSASKADCSAPATPANCPNHGAAVREHDDASTYGTVSTVAFAAGGAALALGTVLVLTAPRSAPTVGVGPVRFEANVAPGTLGLSMRGTFR